MKVLKRILGWGGLLVVSGGIVYLLLRPQPVLVDLAEVDRGPLEVTVDDDGVTRIKDRYVVSTPLTGRLERIHLEVGDPVIADKTVIARMQPTDPSLLDARAVAQARARVGAARRRLDAARAELERAETAAEFAVKELRRAEELSRTNAIAEADLDAKRLEMRLRTEEARAARYRVDIARYELRLEEAALSLTSPASDEPDSPGEHDLEILEIKSPINGRVLRIYQESSAVLNPGQPIMELGDPLDLEVVVDVLSADAVRIAPGAVVRLEHWGGSQPLQGQVRVVEPSGFTKISALGVEEQRVNVIVDLLDPPEQRSALGDNFRVDARIIVWQTDDCLRVPTSALFRQNGTWQAFIVDATQRARLRTVQVGHNNGMDAEVLGGLEAGQRVIVHPGDTVHDGALVQQR
ncbi:MAG: HlyD family efflux transporter periplasmic adaptor subunit [Planctomycetota bacterium]|nr:MAG: HlyD family efflux transporter periplasmic adaptor subunit [Planctomycetota bacterium]